MVADHQGVRNQGGMRRAEIAATGGPFDFVLKERAMQAVRLMF